MSVLEEHMAGLVGRYALPDGWQGERLKIVVAFQTRGEVWLELENSNDQQRHFKAHECQVFQKKEG